MKYISEIKFASILAMIVFNFTGFAQNWQLVWSDEFDSTSINTLNWTKETGGNGWGNNELEYYTNRDINAFIENGHLIIQVLKENYSNRNYTSARLKTQSKKLFKYGKIEANIKLPYGQGIWPAFWTLGQNISSVGWPKCGEIDIMEMIGGQNRENTVHGTAHWDNNGQHAQYGNSYTLTSGIFADDFHKFAIIWTEQYIKWYVDDHLYNTIDITSSGLSEFHNDFFILLNVAVGGNWPGSPDASTVFPQRMEVDYVRVYQDVPVNVEGENSKPEGFNLKQNYPNPFNPTTKINFSLSEDSFVTLKIFNSLGLEIETLVNKNFHAGNHEVSFNADNFSSQVLFYKLSAETKTDLYVTTKKMTLLK